MRVRGGIVAGSKGLSARIAAGVASSLRIVASKRSGTACASTPVGETNSSPVADQVVFHCASRSPWMRTEPRSSANSTSAGSADSSASSKPVPPGSAGRGDRIGPCSPGGGSGGGNRNVSNAMAGRMRAAPYGAFRVEDYAPLPQRNIGENPGSRARTDPVRDEGFALGAGLRLAVRHQRVRMAVAKPVRLLEEGELLHVRASAHRLQQPQPVRDRLAAGRLAGGTVGGGSLGRAAGRHGVAPVECAWDGCVVGAARDAVSQGTNG